MLTVKRSDKEMELVTAIAAFYLGVCVGSLFALRSTMTMGRRHNDDCT